MNNTHEEVAYLEEFEKLLLKQRNLLQDRLDKIEYELDGVRRHLEKFECESIL